MGIFGTEFDDREAFVPEHLPSPGAFLEGADVLTGDEHVRVHELAFELFEERGVYDVTFGYNLAKLNLDPRHPDAGFRYAVDGEELRAEFTPTTAFCPQGEPLAVAAFRAFNGLGDRHEYSIVRVRVDDMHHSSDTVNATVADLESRFLETGEIPGDVEHESIPDLPF